MRLYLNLLTINYFILNDSANFELVYDDYPNVKIYKIK
jgi:hypothetical protein